MKRSRMEISGQNLGTVKEPLINSAAHLAVPFPSCISCKFFDLPPGSADPFSLKTVHRTVFRALEPSKPSEFARAPDEKFTCQLTTSFNQRFLNDLIEKVDLRGKVLLVGLRRKEQEGQEDEK